MTLPVARRDGTCFFEADPDLSLARRAGAEAVGSFCLTFTVVASAFAWKGGAGIGPVARGLSIGPTLTALILLFGLVSGGHFNPLISLGQWFTRRRGGACLAAYVAAQIAGAVLAAWGARLAFGSAALSDSAPPALAGPLAAELFATAGLMMIVGGAPRMRPAGVGPFAVGGFVTMTIAGLPAGPAANPIITVAALVAGLAPSPVSALAHLAAEAVGLLLSILALSLTSPTGNVQHAR